MLTIKQHQNNALPIFLRAIFMKSLDQRPPQPKEKVVELINSLIPRNKMQESSPFHSANCQILHSHSLQA